MLNYRRQAAPYAKIWQEIGLEYLYIEDSLRLGELKKQKAMPATAKPFFVPTPKTQNNSTSAPTQFFQSSPRSSEEAKERIVQHAQNAPIPVLKEYEWPQEWLDLWAKIARHDSPKIAWTYTGLHDDILGTDARVEKRQEIIREFIRGLKSPNGTHIFVPYDMANNADTLLCKEDNSFYWSAVSRLKVKQLLVFGEKARDNLLLPSRNIGSTIIHKGYRVSILPDLNRLIDDMAEVKALLEYLKVQLSSIKI